MPDVSMDLTAELAGIIYVSEEEARLRAQAWRFEQTFEERAEQHSWQSVGRVGANRAEVTSASRAHSRAVSNLAFEQRDRALRQTVREQQVVDSYRAHLAMEMQEDIPAHFEARIADGTRTEHQTCHRPGVL